MPTIIFCEEIPIEDDLADMTLEQLRTEANRLGRIYSQRFQLPLDQYRQIMVCVSIYMMIENLERGVDRWYRIRST